MQITTVLVSLLPAIASAYATKKDGCKPPPPHPPPVGGKDTNFAIMAIASGKVEVHMQMVTACSGSFVLGGSGKSCTSCPAGKDCPKGTDTVLTYHKDTRASMNVAHPAGQQVYVDTYGRLRYIPIDQGKKPIEEVGATEGFKYTAPASSAPGSFGEFTFDGKPWYACPQGTARPINGQPFQVYVDTGKGNDWSQCIQFKGSTLAYEDKPAAWQYN